MRKFWILLMLLVMLIACSPLSLIPESTPLPTQEPASTPTQTPAASPERQYYADGFTRRGGQNEGALL